jgi:hypothetical protein
MVSRPRGESNPKLTRFAGGALHRERYEAVRAPERNRTSDVRVRNPVLYPLSYEGNVQVTGVEPIGLPVYSQRLTPREHLLGVTDGT